MEEDLLEQVLRNQLTMMQALLVLTGNHSDLRATMDATLKALDRLRQERVLRHK